MNWIRPAVAISGTLFALEVTKHFNQLAADVLAAILLVACAARLIVIATRRQT